MKTTLRPISNARQTSLVPKKERDQCDKYDKWVAVRRLGWAVLLIALAVMAAGCFTSNRLVPKTRIEWDKKGNAKVELPKDMEAAQINVTRGTNGVAVEIRDIKVRTNPDVVGVAGQAQVDAINAYGNNMEKAFKGGAELVEKYMGKGAVNPGK